MAQVTSFAQRLATDLRNAYEAHSRDAFDSALARMVAALEYAGPVKAAPAPAGVLAQFRQAMESPPAPTSIDPSA